MLIPNVSLENKTVLVVYKSKNFKFQKEKLAEEGFNEIIFKQYGKKIFKILCFTLVGLLTIVIGYLTYLLCQYNRIEDNKSYYDDISNNQDNLIKVNNTYSAITYNIGFGAFSQDYSFFMDTDVIKDGTNIKGKYSKARSKDEVLKNISGVIDFFKKY